MRYNGVEKKNTEKKFNILRFKNRNYNFFSSKQTTKQY